MADKSKIEWTDATWNPIRARNLKTGKVGWHCVHKSTACEFCYAEGMNKRLGTGLPFKPGHEKDIEIYLDEEMLTMPLRWRRPRKIFVCSMTDLFADFVTDEWIDKMFAVMALCPQHTFQVLTKRPERVREHTISLYKTAAWITTAQQMVHQGQIPRGLTIQIKEPLPNVWLGTSCERQEEADERIPLLLQTPAAIRFVSLEPLLGPIDLHKMPFSSGDPRHRWDALTGQALMYGDGVNGHPDITVRMEKPIYPHLDWVIVGGESGPRARPMHWDWAQSLRNQCEAAGVPFFFKQWGEHAPRWPGDRSDGMEMERIGKKAAGRILDGRTHDEFPEPQTQRSGG